MPNTTPPRAWANGSATASSSTARSPIRTSEVLRDITNLKAGGRQGQGQASGAWPRSCRWWRRRARCPAPRSSITRTRRRFLIALADALHQEYKAIVDAGLYVQIDDAFLPYMHERMVPPMSNADYRRWAQLRVDALNHALEGIPEERSRYHICWGSWNGPHAFDVPLERHHRSPAAGDASATTRSRPPIRATPTSGGFGKP